MKPKIGYLVNDNWLDSDNPEWVFYTEDNIPHYKIEHASKDSYKRIVYWELEE